MQEYQCHKKVKAFKITSIVLSPESNANMCLYDRAVSGMVVPMSWIEKHDPRVGGYFIQYEDGYTSYSPAKAFEEGYTLIEEKVDPRKDAKPLRTVHDPQEVLDAQFKADKLQSRERYFHLSQNQRIVESFIQKIPIQAKDLRTTPGIPSLEARLLSARLMLEEVMETIQDGLGLNINYELSQNQFSARQVFVDFEGIFFTDAREPNLIQIADGLADCEVVNLGTAARCGLGMQTIFDEVMSNNTMKISKGRYDAFGKLIKPKDHPAPDIAGVLEQQGYKAEK